MPDPATSALSRPCGSAFVDGVLGTCGGKWVLAPNVDPAVFGPRRDCGDGHGFDQRKRVVLHDRAILERAGFALVGICHDVFGVAGGVAHGAPLEPGREGSTAAARQARVAERGEYVVGTHLDCLGQRLVAAVFAVTRQAVRVDDPKAVQQP